MKSGHKSQVWSAGQWLLACQLLRVAYCGGWQLHLDSVVAGLWRDAHAAMH
jgi:hypothetical protein